MLLCKALKLQVQFPHLKNGDKSSYLPEFLRGLSEITCGKKAFSRKSDADRVPVNNGYYYYYLISQT